MCKKFYELLQNPDFVGSLIKYTCDDIYYRREIAFKKDSGAKESFVTFMRQWEMQNPEKMAKYKLIEFRQYLSQMNSDTKENYSRFMYMGYDYSSEILANAIASAEENGTNEQITYLDPEIYDEEWEECLHEHGIAAASSDLVWKAFQLHAAAKKWVRNFLITNPRRRKVFENKLSLEGRETLKCIKFLEEIGIPLDCQPNIHGETPLMFVARATCRSEDGIPNPALDALKYLMGKPVNVNAQSAFNGLTALMHLLVGNLYYWEQTYSMALLLLDSFPQLDVCLKDAEGMDALDYVRFGVEEARELIAQNERYPRERYGRVLSLMEQVYARIQKKYRESKNQTASADLPHL